MRKATAMLVLMMLICPLTVGSAKAGNTRLIVHKGQDITLDGGWVEAVIDESFVKIGFDSTGAPSEPSVASAMVRRAGYLNGQPMDVRSHFNFNLINVIEFDDINGDKVLDSPGQWHGTGNETSVSSASMSQQWIHEDPVKAEPYFGRGSAWSFGLSAENITISGGGTLERAHIEFTLSTMITKAKVPMDHYEGNSTGPTALALLETRNKTMHVASYAMEMETTLDGWDLDANNSNPRLMLVYSLTMGDSIMWTDIQADNSDIVETGMETNMRINDPIAPYHGPLTPPGPYPVTPNGIDTGEDYEPWGMFNWSDHAVLGQEGMVIGSVFGQVRNYNSFILDSPESWNSTQDIEIGISVPPRSKVVHRQGFFVSSIVHVEEEDEEHHISLTAYLLPITFITVAMAMTVAVVYQRRGEE